MHKCAESASTPPVPPRRKKRRAKFAAAAKSPQRTSPSLRKPDRKRLAPPPPPPRAARKAKSQTAQDALEETTSEDPVTQDAEGALNSLSSTETDGAPQPSSLRFEDTDLIPTKETSNSANDKKDTRNMARSAALNDRPFPMFETLRNEPNRYPPLLFTLHDFQNVMSDAMPLEEEPSTRSPAGSVRDSFRESFEQSLDEENELCFRVTTTNLPFEKCLDRWNASFADQFIDHVQESSRFIFEDYIDRSNKVNIRRSAGPMCYESFEQEQAVPRLTKVRFVIESPSSSTPNHDLSGDGEDMCDSLQNIEPLVDEVVECSYGTSARLTEIKDETNAADGSEDGDHGAGSQDPDEFGDVPFCSVLETGESAIERPPMENALTSAELAEEGSLAGNEGVDSNDSFGASASTNLQKESFDSKWRVAKMKAADIGKSELNSAMSNMECNWNFVLNKVKDESLKGSVREAASDCMGIDGGPQDDKELADETSEKENNNIQVDEEAVVESTNDVGSEAVEREMRVEFDVEPVISEACFETIERKLTINETEAEVRDQTCEVEDDIAEEHLTSNESETGTYEKAAEEKEEGNEKPESEAHLKCSQEYKRKLFVNDSLRNIINHHDLSIIDSEEENQMFEEENSSEASNKFSREVEESSTNTRSNAREVKNISLPEGTFANDEFPKKNDNVSVPVNIRRNSFLENMLSEESYEIPSMSSCKIVAAHPKPSSTTAHEELLPLKEESHLASRLNESIKMDMEIQKNLRESKEREIPAAVPKPGYPKVFEPAKKNAGEAKCDVLNELLSNFNHIKLKPVNIVTKSNDEGSPQVATTRQTDDNERIESKSENHMESVRNTSTSHSTIIKAAANSNATLEQKIPLPPQRSYDETQMPTGFLMNDQKLTLQKSDRLPEKPTEASNVSSSINTIPRLGSTVSLRSRETARNGSIEVVKVDVHRPEWSQNEDHPESPISTGGSRFEPRKSDVTPQGSDRGVVNSAGPPQLSGCGEKTDANVRELKRRCHAEDVSCKRGQQLELRTRADSGEKSAIARRIPRPHCNNNDNNRAVTPVAVSDDQSRDTMTITPGRVRSFVKYYEIRGEATTADKDSKSNDREIVERDAMTGHQSVFSIRRGLEARAIEARSLDARKDHFQGSMMDRGSDILMESTRNEIKPAAVGKHGVEQDPNLFDDRVERLLEDGGVERVKVRDGVRKSHGDSSKQPGMVRRKKSVKFQGGYTVIGTGSPDENGAVGSLTSGEAKSTGKKRAPGRPEIGGTVFSEKVEFKGAGVEFVDADSCSVDKREIAAQIQAAAEGKECSGEEVVTVPPTSGGQDSWKVQTLSLSTESPSNRRRGCRPQLQPGKRTRPAPPPPSISCKVNARDINKYFDWPNKENTPRNAVNASQGTNEPQPEDEQSIMGSNLSRHNGKGLTGRRTQSSGNLCEPKGKLNTMGKILVPCSSAQKERYKFCGSLPNHLDDKDVLDDGPKENNNIMTDTLTGNLGGTLPHKKRSLGVHFSDGGPTGTLDLVKHRSQDSLDENDPWRYQQSDLDLVRCRHGNFDSVRRNRSVDVVSSDSARRYNRGASVEDRCHRNSDLDLVGTLPKRKPDARNGGKGSETNSSSAQPCIPDHVDNDLLMQIVHKPDCELVRHRQQLGKCIDLKLNKLVSGEPQDQGYASERSPEDEHPPSLPGQPFPNITPESTFRVTLQKSSRGLGLSVSGGGTAGPVRVKRLFPQQPAALSNKLQSGDILLAANGIPLTGLTNYEALEVLRTTPSTVELVVCRLPGDTNVTPPGSPPLPPVRRESPLPPGRRESPQPPARGDSPLLTARREQPPLPLRIRNPLPPLQIEPCGEFDIEMTKVGGSLGFTLRKADSSALGHYVRALVREPALSDGRIRPGDKIVAVDGAPLSPMSHEEAVQLLRQCGPTVRLRLYRDLAQTPVSALSPTEPDHPLRPPRTSLRQEAVDMLCDLAVRKLSPGTSSGSSCKQSPGASCNFLRRRRNAATPPSVESEQESLEKHPSVHATSTASQAETSDSDQCSIRTQITNSQPNTPGTDIIDPPPLYDVCDSSDSSKAPPRPSFLDLTAPQGKPHFQFCSLDSDLEYPGGDDGVAAEDVRGKGTEPDYQRRETNVLSGNEHDTDLPSEPASMPPVLSSTSNSSTAAFSYKNPAYQSANPACGSGIDATTKNKATHSSDQDIPGRILGAEDPGGSKGLLKWKGVMFAPDDGIDETENEEERVGRDTTDSAVLSEELEQGTETDHK
ncbi:uncharacterized protein LOC143371323 isoform X2 [Andrena cerasifolii]|uniref:uncharacterized protein LOC143371323 isoform X2 n=1 Tax=Andrena cerasifolii TaxID=2819439 RepID=UPI004037A841